MILSFNFQVSMSLLDDVSDSAARRENRIAMLSSKILLPQCLSKPGDHPAYKIQEYSRIDTRPDAEFPSKKVPSQYSTRSGAYSGVATATFPYLDIPSVPEGTIQLRGSGYQSSHSWYSARSRPGEKTSSKPYTRTGQEGYGPFLSIFVAFRRMTSTP
jgi:hypothetical protein